jgi:hypothetical protein
MILLVARGRGSGPKQSFISFFLLVSSFRFHRFHAAGEVWILSPEKQRVGWAVGSDDPARDLGFTTDDDDENLGLVVAFPTSG